MFDLFDFTWLSEFWGWWTGRSGLTRALIGTAVMAAFGLYWGMNPQHYGAAVGVGVGGLLVLTALVD